MNFNEIKSKLESIFNREVSFGIYDNEIVICLRNPRNLIRLFFAENGMLIGSQNSNDSVIEKCFNNPELTEIVKQIAESSECEEHHKISYEKPLHLKLNFV